jgi:hypothetical protein
MNECYVRLAIGNLEFEQVLGNSWSYSLFGWKPACELVRWLQTFAQTSMLMIDDFNL